MISRLWGGLLLMGWAVIGHADEVKLRVAAASSLHHAAEALGKAFAATHPATELEFSFAATGNLVAQIRHGAPFDLLLAADLAYPRALIDAGFSPQDKPVVYASGRLVLWPDPTPLSPAEALQQTATRRIAIAQPDIAPYGNAARVWLKQQDLWADATSKIVTAENVAQTLQFAAGGHADFGFVAASLLAPHEDLEPGVELQVPDSLLDHGAIALRRSPHPAAVSQFISWLDSAEAREVLQEHGYRVP